jgi:anti-sigma factor RsiW
MNCPRIQPLLSEYLDGELNAERAAAVEQHLAGCPDCTQLWQELRGTVRIVAHLGRQRCPVDLRPAVMQAVSRTPARPAGSVLVRRIVTALAGGGAVAASLAFPFLLQQPASRVSRMGHRSAELAPSRDTSVHVQYNMATSLGTADGLLLSLPANPEGAAREPHNPVQR